MPSNELRRIRSHPTYCADVSGEYEDKTAEWFELFLDLIYVAACSNVAENLKEDVSSEGLFEFIVIFLFFTSGWHMYTFFNTRFNDSSIEHHGYLVLFILASAAMAVSAHQGVAFTVAAISQRLVLFIVYGTVYLHLPETRSCIWLELVVLLSSCCCLLLSLCSERYRLVAYIAALFFEIAFYIEASVQGWMMNGNYVPMNIDHFSERESCFMMVVLGESIVSCVIGVDQISPHLSAEFYGSMALSILLAFLLGMFYYNVLPPRELHAIRRSARAGTTYVLLHHILFVSLLSMGVGIKFVTDAVKTENDLTTTEVSLLLGSMSVSMAAMLGIRLLHFYGRQPRLTDPDNVKRIKYIWWIVNGISPTVPLVAILVPGIFVAPLSALSFAVFSIIIYVVFEIAIAHKLHSLGFGDMSVRSSVSNTEHSPLIIR